MTRFPPRSVPVDEDSKQHKVALEIEATMHAEMRNYAASSRAERHARPGHAWGPVIACVCALAALGYRDWLIWPTAWLSAGSPHRRRQIIDRCRGFHWVDRFEDALNVVGYRPPRVAAGRRDELVDAYVDIDAEGHIEWGFRPTKNLDLCMWAQDRMVLIVSDGGEEVAGERVTLDGIFVHHTTMSKLHLNDDDYRFTVRIENDYGESGGMWVDMARIDGEWQELDFQGKDWNGEHGDSGIVHVVTAEAAAEKAEKQRLRQAAIDAENRERAARKAREEAERKAEAERRERERIGRLVAKGMASAGLQAVYETMVAEAEAEVAAVDGVTKASVIAEAEGHVAHFKSRNDPRAAARWQSVVDRLEGRGGISDEDLAAWLAEARAGGWRRGLQTLPKAIAVLKGEEAEAEVAAEKSAAETDGVVTVRSVLVEVDDHIDFFTGSRNHRAAERWDWVARRLRGERGGITDAELDTWLAEAKAGGWKRGLQTLPKAIAVLKGD